MKAVVFTKYGTPDVLELKEVDKPIPKDDEVLIKVYAVSINDWDWGLLQGIPFMNRLLYGLLKPKKKILGSDIAGRIEKLLAAINKETEVLELSQKIQSQAASELGKTQREALRDMADRLGLSEMTSFVAAVIQSQILGVSLAKVLRIQSDQMRIRRRQRAEEEAHKAPVKMILPMAFLIFPSILIILLTPAGIQIAQTLGAAFGI